MIPSLLITDDDSAFRDSLCEGLTRRGFHVLPARDGEEAIEICSRGQVHMAIVDHHMPRVTGLEVLRHLRQNPKSPPCVLMSADLDEEICRQAAAMNAYKVLSKPFRLVQLSQLVGAALAEIYGWRPQV